MWGDIRAAQEKSNRQSSRGGIRIRLTGPFIGRCLLYFSQQSLLMSSFPLTIWKTFRGEQDEVANAEEYQPLANDPSAPEPPEPAQMGTGEQMLKPETRKGDLPAEWAAYVSLSCMLPP